MDQKRLYTLLYNKLKSTSVPIHVNKAPDRVLSATAKALAAEVLAELTKIPTKASPTNVALASEKYD